MEVEPNAEKNTTYKKTLSAYLTLLNLFYYASFFGVTALCVDRFLAIHLHLSYQELVTHKRVVAGAISTWVLSASLSLTGLLLLARKDKKIVFATIEVFLPHKYSIGFTKRFIWLYDTTQIKCTPYRYNKKAKMVKWQMLQG